MEWEFSADQVVRGEVEYGLAEFRRDLAREVAANLGVAAGPAFDTAFGPIYDLCHALATGRTFETFVRDGAFDAPTTAFLRSLVEPMQANVEMLGAILQCLIAERVASGLSLDRAVDDVARHHRDLVATGAHFLTRPDDQTAGGGR